MTPDRAAERNTGSGNLPAGGDSYRRPSGRHATADGRHLTVRALGKREDEPLKEWLDYRDALAMWWAYRGKEAQPGRHASRCPNGDQRDHRCAFQTVVLDGVLVRPSGVVVGGVAA